MSMLHRSLFVLSNKLFYELRCSVEEYNDTFFAVRDHQSCRGHKVNFGDLHHIPDGIFRR